MTTAPPKRGIGGRSTRWDGIGAFYAYALRDARGTTSTIYLKPHQVVSDWAGLYSEWRIWVVAPDPEEWLALDEHERIDLARDYHRKARIRLPNARVHATVHAIVETQIALGDKTPARRTAQRLMNAGLDCHETIHAIGWVLIDFMQGLMEAPELGTEPNAPYFAALERLTVEDWRRLR